MRSGTVALGVLLVVAGLLAFLVGRVQGETFDQGLKEAPLTAAAAALAAVGGIVIVVGVALPPISQCEYCGARIEPEEKKCEKCGRARIASSGSGP